MSAMKLTAGQPFPAITVPKVGGGEIDLSTPLAPCDWRMVVIYRGKWCPFCAEYLVEIKEMLAEFKEVGVDVVALSADTEEWAGVMAEQVEPNYDMGYGLTVEQMETLGLYISSPRSEVESDHPFAEPALFIVNDQKQVQIIDISNIAFARPELKTLVRGLKHIRAPGNNYPVRGTFSSAD